MPRIRSIKPEALQHRKIGRFSDRTFRLWIGMITQADDEGRLAFDVEQLRVICFGYHKKVVIDHVIHAINDILKVGSVKLYRINGTLFAWFPSWKDHQYINKPTPSLLPPYDKQHDVPCLDSEQSLFDACGSEGSEGKDRIGKEDIRSLPVHRDEFEKFWQAYPRKVGKGYAHTCFLKALNKTTVDIIITAVEQQKTWSTWTKDSGEFIPHPSTWLNQERWLDELPKVRTRMLTPKIEGNLAALEAFVNRDERKPMSDETAKENLAKLKDLVKTVTDAEIAKTIEATSKKKRRHGQG